MRKSLGISQLELALRLGMSQRHIGFVELGRSQPSRGLILSWTRETEGTVDERNAALVSAGYSPALLESEYSDCRSSPEFQALREMLLMHEPNPGLIFDADWVIRAMSEGGQWLSGISMAGFLDQGGGASSEMDMIAAVAHPAGLLSKATNAAEVGHALLTQLRTEEMTRPSLRARVDMLDASLQDRFGAEVKSQRAPGNTHLQIILNTEFGQLRFLLVQTVFGLPQNVTQKSLRSELWFPVDDATRVAMATRGRARLASGHHSPPALNR